MNLNRNKTLIIAHRGASYDAPENTLAAVQLAWEQDADGVEVDIQLSRDGHVVVFHDEDTTRFDANGRNVRDLTLDELRRLDVGSHKGERWQGERIPLLSDVLSHIPPGKVILIEIKCGPEIIPALQRDISNCSLAAEYVIFIGFHRETMQAVKTHLSGYPALRLYEFYRDPIKGWSPKAEAMIAEVREDGLDGLDVSHGPAIDSHFVRKVHESELPLFVWTVNDRQEANTLQNLGVAGITTDLPLWLRQGW